MTTILNKFTREYYIEELIKNGVNEEAALFIMKSIIKKTIKPYEFLYEFQHNEKVVDIIKALDVIGADLISASALAAYNGCRSEEYYNDMNQEVMDLNSTLIKKYMSNNLNAMEIRGVYLSAIDEAVIDCVLEKKLKEINNE